MTFAMNAPIGSSFTMVGCWVFMCQSFSWSRVRVKGDACRVIRVVRSRSIRRMEYSFFDYDTEVVLTVCEFGWVLYKIYS